MNIVGALHARLVMSRRVQVLTRHLASLATGATSCLDVGSGDGAVGAALSQRIPDLQVAGVDVLLRDDAAIPTRAFDGHRLPFDDASIDIVLLVDVLHHTDHPEELLRESVRVARNAVLLKDHYADGWIARPTLRIMDWVGNAPHGVRLPYNYLKREAWARLFEQVAVCPTKTIDNLGLYPAPIDSICGRGLHFVSRLEPIGR